MTVARSAAGPKTPSASSRPAANTRRSKLAAATEPPIRPGPATSVVAMGGTGVDGCITLANAQLRLDVAPALGGGITRFDWRSDGALVNRLQAVLGGAELGDPRIIVHDVEAHHAGSRLAGAPHGDPFRLRVVRRETFGRGGMTLAPGGQRGHRLVLGLGAGDLDQRHHRPTPSGPVAPRALRRLLRGSEFFGESE